MSVRVAFGLVVAAAVVGYIMFWPSLLWCYGPTPHQYYVLREQSPPK